MTGNLIALDWGTSSLRVALLRADGTVVEEHGGSQGILAVAPGGFPAVFAQAIERWRPAPGQLCLASGMVGSRQGWREAPYCPCPAGFDDLARHLAWVPDAPGGVRLGIVPGLSSTRGGVPDVMRGEEIQVMGALALLDRRDGVFVLPGTHSKWVRVAAGRIVDFATFMTGEVYALLRKHSILARTLPPEDGPLDDEAFLRGAAHARASGSLLQAAFSARTLALFDALPPAAQPSYLSGLLVGEELRAQQLPAGAPVVLIGAEALTTRYALALQALGVPSHRLGAEATWRGLGALARTLPPPP
ncbi:MULTISPECIES: 2-dehydro-3-deoxygalactonokinase [Ramlibacter]|uniref:2-dehydro-3-deoxygalactonokinase n=1 Tax=Ramlibacter pinisoli TaxID=2682844 RepID=A0A6N8IX59_9BURK|nr:2-dehydro-3-deoxygalactonokinase [Ramlibacter sp. CGMCC 1.13660]MVQ31579.1 2-dehydro-3-deoxygalactonokinase [Ramlibacter pinisoli]